MPKATEQVRDGIGTQNSHIAKPGLLSYWGGSRKKQRTQQKRTERTLELVDLSKRCHVKWRRLKCTACLSQRGVVKVRCKCT